MRRTALLILVVLLATNVRAADWFETFKDAESKESLYRLLYAMPKGGDLHNHLAGAVRSEWWWDLALAAEARGYRYYTKTRIANCRPYGTNEYGRSRYLLLFVNVTEVEWRALDECERQEYEPLAGLDAVERAAWLESLRLDAPHEGRDEFFEAHWPRLNTLVLNPWLVAEVLYLNMRAFGAEGLLYLETQQGARGFRMPDGTAIDAERVAEIFAERLERADARATGVTVRLQEAILRFTPRAEDALRAAVVWVVEHPVLWVGVNMVGREDDDKGYPLRFLPVLRELRRSHPGIRLSIHAGEVDEPNYHVRDTLLLGASRIGHGLNLITDPETLMAMRDGPYLVEINLISNLLLEYVASYAAHPFPEYLRTGVPVALSTDDRGMWDSTMTDEFFVAVTEFDLSWEEIKQLSRNSLSFSFVQDDVKRRLLAEYDGRIARFERDLERRGAATLEAVRPEHWGFICRKYGLCSP